MIQRIKIIGAKIRKNSPVGEIPLCYEPLREYDVEILPVTHNTISVSGRDIKIGHRSYSFFMLYERNPDLGWLNTKLEIVDQNRYSRHRKVSSTHKQAILSGIREALKRS